MIGTEEQTVEKLLGSLLLFTQAFFKLRTGRDFRVSHPPSRQSHTSIINQELEDVFNQKIVSTNINVPPRYGKSELVIHFVAWALAHYPDSNFLYISCTHELATTATKTIREIVSMPIYRKLFGVELSQDSSAKDNFQTNFGGSVYAVGAGGTIVGKGAGVRDVLDRFTGAIILDDTIKPHEATSDTIRTGINFWYNSTVQSRRNNTFKTPVIHIGQRVHENDLSYKFVNDSGFHSVIIKALDEAGNALDPELHTKTQLLELKERSPYEFASQYQQNPVPAGGGVFKKEWFVLLDEEPEIISTFLTLDTAETSQNYNDASVFSFWGIYKLRDDMFALHWIDCVELRVEPHQLENEFNCFYRDCLRHKKQPDFVAIEKKSTGVTLSSVLKNLRGINILEVERTVKSGDKSSRFLSIQHFLASKFISLPRLGRHTNLCIEHCSKITANNTHRHDDIADTLFDAVNFTFIDKYAISRIGGTQALHSSNIVKKLNQNFNTYLSIRSRGR